MSVYTYVTANCWCSSEERSITSIIKLIIPDYRNTNVKKTFY